MKPKFFKTLLYFQPGEPPQQTQYQVYGIRWLILILFVMYSTSNAFQWTQVRFFYKVDWLTWVRIWVLSHGWDNNHHSVHFSKTKHFYKNEDFITQNELTFLHSGLFQWKKKHNKVNTLVKIVSAWLTIWVTWVLWVSQIHRKIQPQLVIITNILEKYYGVPTLAVSWTSMIFMVTYIPLIFPASWFLQKKVRIPMGETR